MWYHMRKDMIIDVAVAARGNGTVTIYVEERIVVVVSLGGGE